MLPSVAPCLAFLSCLVVFTLLHALKSGPGVSLSVHMQKESLTCAKRFHFKLEFIVLVYFYCCGKDQKQLEKENVYFSLCFTVLHCIGPLALGFRVSWLLEQVSKIIDKSMSSRF